MKRVPSRRMRLVVLLCSLAGSVLLVLGLLHGRARDVGRTVQVIDGSAGLEGLLAERGAEPEIPLEGWPPRLVREPLTEELARGFYAWNELEHWSFEPVVGTRRRGKLDLYCHFREHPRGGWRVRTNSLGFRNDEEPASEPPDLRILVAGDSQTEGLCGNDESWVHRLGALLREARPGRSVETLNAGLAGTNPYTYLGVLERYAELAPDVFVAVFFGGNDFRDALALQRHFHRRPARQWGNMLREVADRLAEYPQGLLYSEVWQPAYFRAVPEETRVAVGTWAALALEMQRQCDELGARFLCVYFPSPYEAQPSIYAEERARVLELLEGLELDLELGGRMADAWIDLLDAHGVPVLDLRPALRAATERLFWREDYHLNLEGQQVVAEALLAAFQAPE